VGTKLDLSLNSHNTYIKTVNKLIPKTNLNENIIVNITSFLILLLKRKYSDRKF